MKRAGVHADLLLRFYVTFIRPMVEYATPVWHPGLTQHLSDQLESAAPVSALHPLRSILQTGAGGCGTSEALRQAAPAVLKLRNFSSQVKGL